MPAAFEIVLKVGDIDRALRGLDRLGERYQGIAQSQKALQSSTSSIAAASGRGGGSGGPYSAMASADARVRSALQGGNRLEIADAQVARLRAIEGLKRAQRLVNPPPPKASPSTMDRLMTAVSTSRFGLGPMSPLVGRSLAALGVPAAAAGPVGMAIMGGAVALRGFIAAVELASDRLQNFGDARRTSGGSTRDIARLAALGIPVGDVAGMSAGLAQRMSSDAGAMTAASRLGIGPVIGRPYGPVNEARLLEQVLARLDTVQGTERLVLARQLGLEGQLRLLDVDKDIKAGRRLDTSAGAMAYTAANQRLGNNYDAQMARMTGNWDKIVTILSSPAVGAAADAFGLIADALAVVTGLADKIPGLGEALIPAPLRPFKAIGDMKRAFAGETGKIEENTKAIQENTQTLKAGTYNMGPRGQGAIPRELQGELRRKQLESGAADWGAWSL